MANIDFTNPYAMNRKATLSKRSLRINSYELSDRKTKVLVLTDKNISLNHESIVATQRKPEDICGVDFDKFLSRKTY